MAALTLMAGCGIAASASARAAIVDPWPDPAAVAGIRGEAVTFPSSSPFVPADIGREADDPPTTATGWLFLPPGAHAEHWVPAVILLHGSSGVLPHRELTYGPQLASMGVAVLVVDAFGARRDRATSFTDRLLQITETMLIADAYAGLRYLASQPMIDAGHVVLTGFSYGAMATMYALQRQIADRMAPQGLRFAGHVAFYGPCIARFADRRTTGAPLMMLRGADDEIVDAGRCAEVAQDARDGGSEVETIVYPGAVHQWDGDFDRRLIGRNLAGCSLEVEPDGSVRDRHTGLTMAGPFTRRLILALCVSSRPYPIGRDDHVRVLSNRDFGRFLMRVFDGPPAHALP